MRIKHWLAIFIVLLALPVQSQSEPARYCYVYGIEDEANLYHLYFVDPTKPDGAARIITLPASMYPTYGAHPSPDGRWIVLSYSANSYSRGGLFLFDVTTGAIRGITSVLFSHEISDLGIAQWSPDSQYLALNANLGDFNDDPAYIYSLQSNILTPIIPADDPTNFMKGLSVFRLWSPDSRRLIFTRNTCPAPQQICPLELAIVDTATLKLQTTTEVDNDICNLLWSPDERYITFQQSCGYGIPFYELFVWDTHQGKVQQITAYTNPPPPWDEYPPLSGASYSQIWLNEQTLLVGVSAGQFIPTKGTAPESFVSETILYHFQSASGIQVSDALNRDWERNPATGELAFLSLEQAVDSEGEIFNKPTSVQIGNLANDKLHTSVTAPPGCNLSWSPDGDYLAYTIADSCEEHITPTSLIFVNDADGRVSEIRLPALNNRIKMIGWVRMIAPDVNPNPYFLAGTPTPFPTPSAAG